MKKVVYLIMALGVFNFTSCIDDDDGGTPDVPPLDKGNIEVNRIIISFTSSANTSDVRSFEYYDADGFNSGNPPSINETIELDVPASGTNLPFDSKTQLFKDNNEVTSGVENLGTKYIICYRGWAQENFRLTGINNDVSGKKLGTEVEWLLSNENGSGNIRITLNYLPLVKEGICDAGFRIFETTLNYQNK
ncbi:MAG: hypothetical protein JKY48_20350 [Flavobacteriales bacterium]|nr:hypothetical protein [Flavobacteriales bacterium]